MPPAHLVLGPRLTVGWGLSTLSLSVFCGLSEKERSDLIRRLRGRPTLPVGMKEIGRCSNFLRKR